MIESLLAAQNKLLSAIASELAEIAKPTEGTAGTTYETNENGTAAYRVTWAYDMAKARSVEIDRVEL